MAAKKDLSGKSSAMTIVRKCERFSIEIPLSITVSCEGEGSVRSAVSLSLKLARAEKLRTALLPIGYGFTAH